jgi:alkylation response protein AidB-like acyl-CoA dehydrogenase
MDFSLTPDQRLMQDSVSGTLARVCTLERLRTLGGHESAATEDIWSALSELGAAGVIIPEEFGGLGLGLLDAALIAEALGRLVAPTPFLGSAVLAPVALMTAGSTDQQGRWLPSLASGDVLAGVAMSEAVSGARDGAGVTARNGKLSGASLFALDAAGANILIVADREGALHLVISDAPGLEIRPLVTIDVTRRVGELRFDNTPAEPLALGTGSANLTRLRDAAWVMLAADMLGAGDAMIAKAVSYAQERKQFGRLIGSFQAVKHLCAEMAAELEPCRSLVWYAAYAFDALPAEASVVAAHAKAHLSEVSRFVARTSTEVHGGIGITDLLGLHYWFKRVGLDRQLLGGPERIREMAAAMQDLA